jgi:hypothetical protein
MNIIRSLVNFVSSDLLLIFFHLYIDDDNCCSRSNNNGNIIKYKRNLLTSSVVGITRE